jgi:hypothetical protein
MHLQTMVAKSLATETTLTGDWSAKSQATPSGRWKERLVASVKSVCSDLKLDCAISGGAVAIRKDFSSHFRGIQCRVDAYSCKATCKTRRTKSHGIRESFDAAIKDLSFKKCPALHVQPDSKEVISVHAIHIYV